MYLQTASNGGPLLSLGNAAAKRLVWLPFNKLRVPAEISDVRQMPFPTG